MNVICVSLKELYRENGAHLQYGGYIDYYSEDECEYYDLMTVPPDLNGSIILCCDGEECEIIDNNDEAVLLSNLSTGNKFYLSKEEYNISIFE